MWSGPVAVQPGRYKIARPPVREGLCPSSPGPCTSA
jgi:hypothetical protein